MTVTAFHIAPTFTHPQNISKVVVMLALKFYSPKNNVRKMAYEGKLTMTTLKKANASGCG